MNRSDFQKLSEMRVADAQILIEARRFEAAYYLLGYSVECALKACIAKQIREFDFPDRKFVNGSYVHDLEKLLGLSGVEQQHERESKSNAAFAANWNLVKDWSENSRYEGEKREVFVRDFFDAVTNPRDGVVTWLMKHW